jgi:bifunctional non-homologous end joining protein LigD
LVDKPPTRGTWTYEIKFDGYRLLARIDGSEVRLFTRNGHDWTTRLKHLARAVADLDIGSGWIDGEIVVLLDHGRTDFQALQNAFDTSHTGDIRYFVFDLPYYAGHDLRAVPLRERRKVLRDLLERHPSNWLQFSEDFDADPASMLEAARELKLEGMIGKRVDSPYLSARSANWIKLKVTQRQEFVIGGYTDPRGKRTGLGSLLLGVHDADGKLRYAGNVGTGFDAKTLNDLTAKLKALATDKTPFDDLPRGIKGHWVRPKLVGEVSFGEWTQDGRIRHSVFHGLRVDKSPARITRERPVEVAAVVASKPA